MTLEEDALRDLPFLIVALLIHGVLLSAPILRWSASRSALDTAIAVDFVAAPPVAPPPAPPVEPPSPALAPVPAGADREGVPHKGPGDFHPEQHEKPKTRMTAPKAQKGRKAPARLKRAPLVLKAKPTPEQVQAAAFRRAKLAAVQAENKHIREEKLIAARMAAAAAAEKRAEEERKRQEEQLRLAEERKRQEQEALQARARRRADASRALATLDDPDERVSDALADQPSEGPASGSPRGRGREQAALPSASIKAARMRDGSEPVYEMDASGSGSKNVKTSGGGTGVDGGGLSWSLEGPAGSRRLLKRTIPTSPDWVSQRGLDLSVQVKFQVQSDGGVKPGAVIKKTSGFPEIDQRAVEALKRWRFDAATGGASPETWGIVTFRFLMG